jgi:flavin reductase (DIM6/NTAB) family NADH-FMN oxidoreductase RutF
VPEASIRDVMRTFPQGVIVVTAKGEEGPRGITVSSFASVSLTPPLVLVCIMREARAHQAIDAGHFVVNVLAENQGAVSDHFANSNLSSAEQFEGYGVSRLEGCLGYLHCKVVDRIPTADHTIFIGEVEQADVGQEGNKPLVFFSRNYWGLGSTVYERC